MTCQRNETASPLWERLSASDAGTNSRIWEKEDGTGVFITTFGIVHDPAAHDGFFVGACCDRKD
jgi:hypothetical protein